jgi:regulatory protein
MDGNSKKVLEILQAQCSKREYCTSDILEKASRRLDWDTSAAEEVAAALVKDDFVNDLRFAEAFARDKSSLSGWGTVKIRYALAARRIPKETIDRALAGIDTGRAADKMTRLLESKWKTLEGDGQGRLKLLKFALSRGYEYDDVKQAVDEITSR